MQTTGSTLSSWSVLGGLLALALAQPYLGCLPEPEPTTRLDGARDVLVDVGSEVVVPALDGFLDEMAELRAAIAGDDLDAARDAFVLAMQGWQQLEVMQIGPAASSLATKGGADLRDEIYSWPTVNPCRVDQVTATGDFSAPGFVEASLVNSYGLDAIEYLLFSTPGVNACPELVAPNQDGAWQALGEAEIATRRLEYALVAADAVVASAEQIREAWTMPGGFGTSLATAGESGSDFADDTEALDVVFDAMFYLDLVTKDAKLATPLGLRPEDCTAACEEHVESPLSGTSTAAIVANLRGFRALFTGGGGKGFDDLLTGLGESELAERILANTDAAIALGEHTASLSTLLPADPAPALALLDAVQLVTEDLEGDLATLLSLQIPTEVAGDND